MTTTIFLRNTWTAVKSDDRAMLEHARDMSSFTMTNWQIRRSKWMDRLRSEKRVCKEPSSSCTCEWCRADKWDGKKFFGKNVGGGVEIPTGVAFTFIRLMRVLGEELIIHNERESPPPLPDVDWSLKREPRPYQQDAVDAILNAGGRGIIKSPTASGKTVMMAMLVGHLKCTAIIKVPRLVLMDQVRQELLDTLNIDESEIGTIGRGKFEPSMITITTTQSLANLLKKKEDWRTLMGLHMKYGWGLLIEDEVHHGSTTTSFDTSMAIDAFYRVGFSATPLMREDGENVKIIGAFGEIVHEIAQEPLVASGWLIKPEIKFLPTKAIPTASGDKWQQVYEMGIVFNRDRNLRVIATANKLHGEGRSTLIFVDRIDHGNELLNLAESYAGHKMEFVHGDHPDREDIIARFKAKELKTMISTEGIIGEGFDFRGLDAIIIADGGKSSIQTLQKVGRAMRPEDGKVDCKIYDFGDKGKYLTDHAMIRKTTWLKHGFQLDLSDTPYLR